MYSLQVRSCIPELYFLKYRAVPAPWECESNAKRFGFKCIKYASWKDVHASAESAASLREVGSSLVDEGVFPVSLYGEFALVWERVRRWTSDKEGLSIEPEFTPEYESASRTMSLGSQDGRYVLSFLGDNVVGFSPENVDVIWVAFKQLVLVNLLGHSKAVKAFKMTLPRFDDWQVVQKRLNALDEIVVQLYAALGFEVKFDSAGEACDLLLEEMGLAVDAPKLSLADQPRARASSDVLIEKKDRLDSRLVEAKLVGNSMVLTLNGRHPAMQADSPYCAFFADEGQWRAFGRACRDHLGNMEEVQSFLDSWGLHLNSVMRASRRAQSQ